MKESPEQTPLRPCNRLLAALLLCTLLTACGQRGPLFLPEDPPEAATTGQEEEETEDENDEETPRA